MMPDLFRFERPSIIVRWRFGWLTVRWPNGTRGCFRTWHGALFSLGGDDILRIRP